MNREHKRVFISSPIGNIPIVLAGIALLLVIFFGKPVKPLDINGYILFSIGILLAIVCLLSPTERVIAYDDYYIIKYFVFTLVKVPYKDTYTIKRGLLFFPMNVFGYFKKDKDTAVWVPILINEVEFCKLLQTKNPDCRFDHKIEMKMK